MNRSTVCVVCRATLSNGMQLCPAHTEALEAALARVPTMLDELDVTITRQSRMTQQIGPRSTTRPLPFAMQASKAHAALSAAVARWARTYGVQRYASSVARSGAPRACARYLRELLPFIVRHHEAGALLAEIEALNTQAQQVIDRPPDYVYVGICSVDGCERDVYAHVDAVTVRCPQCRARHDVASRRETMLASVEDQLATAVEIARAVATYGAEGEYLATATIRKWHQRGRLVPRGIAARGVPTYRVGDVIALMRHGTRAKA